MTTDLLSRRSFATGAELAPEFARWTAELLAKAIAERGAALLAVSGGSTPQALFRRVVAGGDRLVARDSDAG